MILSLTITGINLEEKQAKQAARTKSSASPPNAKRVAKTTPSLRRSEQVTPSNTKQVNKTPISYLKSFQSSSI